ncbi:HAD family hydrolase [Sorangium sp. So ce1078]|uniref:HAD family hydrolase n=1 Tax=Sorangium sp. So ce1078 TaxID=3133329 RepID=UPI003F615612
MRYAGPQAERVKAILFDCDGTLVDSERLGNEVLVEHAAEHGVSVTVGEAMALFRGGKMADCVAALEVRAGRALPPSFVGELRRRTAVAFRERLRPMEGALALVSALSIPFCVASSGPREKIELSLSVTGLLPFFSGRIFSSYEVGTWKPDPGLFLHAAGALGARPSECVVVEDSLPGIAAGLAAGMTVVALQPERSDERIPDGVRVVRSLTELHGVLGAPAASPARPG